METTKIFCDDDLPLDVLTGVIDCTDAVCLMCYLLNGHVVVFTVPSLKPLIDVDCIPSPNVRSVACHQMTPVVPVYSCSQPTDRSVLSS